MYGTGSVLAGKVIEATRSCIYKQGDLVAGRAGQGFCKKDHKVLYYKIPISTGTYSQLPTAPYNIVYHPGDIVIEEIPPVASKNYRAFKCLQDDYNLEKFKSLSERPIYYTQIWQGLKENGYQDSGFNDETEGHCPYGEAWDEYFDAATDEQIEAYVMGKYLQ